MVTTEKSTTHQPTVRLNRVPSRGGGSADIPLFLVRECVPAMASVAHEAALRTAHIKRADEALALPWIEKLPGQKRIRFVHGQIFVIQHYLGMRVIRAHICRDEERHTNPPGQCIVCPEVVLESLPLNHPGMVVHV
jgi:hypothetical protein